MSTTVPDKIKEYVNENRKSTLLLFVLSSIETYSWYSNRRIKSYFMKECTDKYFEIQVEDQSSVKTNIRKNFDNDLKSNSDAYKQFISWHEKELFVSLPPVLQGTLALLLWFPLPLCWQNIQRDMPLFIQPYLPSPHVALIAVGCVTFIHFLEGLLVVSMLVRTKVSTLTIISWFGLTMLFGYLQTEKALFLHKVYSKGPPKAN